jgi:hypothetical protein
MREATAKYQTVKRRRHFVMRGEMNNDDRGACCGNPWGSANTSHDLMIYSCAFAPPPGWDG